MCRWPAVCGERRPAVRLGHTHHPSSSAGGHHFSRLEIERYLLFRHVLAMDDRQPRAAAAASFPLNLGHPGAVRRYLLQSPADCAAQALPKNVRTVKERYGLSQSLRRLVAAAECGY